MTRPQLPGTLDQHQELWSVDHANAMRALDIEEALPRGIAAFRALHALDLQWRDDVYERERRDLNDVEEAIFRSLLLLWMSQAMGVQRELARCEADGHRVDRAEEFRKCVEEMRWILLPEDQKFSEDFLERMFSSRND